MAAVWITIVVVQAVVCGALGAYVSAAKNRDAAEGLILGVLLGVIGVLIAALLPTVANEPKRRLNHAAWPDEMEAWRNPDGPPPIEESDARKYLDDE